MTGKRFRIEYIKYTGQLIDNKYNTFYPIEDTEENINLLCSRLNQLNEENTSLKSRLMVAQDKIRGLMEDYTENNLHEENMKIKSLLLKKVEELNEDYERSARAGMPTGGIIGELDSFEEICRVMGWIE